METTLSNLTENDVEVYTLGSGEQATLIAVHGAGGMLWCGRLSRQVGKDYSFYALQGAGLDEKTANTGTTGIHELAKRYVDTISSLPIYNPVFICGRFSPIVLETGRRLVEQGFGVKAIIVFDVGIGVDPNTQPTSRSHEPPSLFARLMRLVKHVPGTKKLRKRIREWYTGHEPSKSNPFKLVNEQLKARYKPEKKYPGKVILIRCHNYANRPDKDNQITRWQAMSDELEVYVVPGHHHSMFKLPDIEHLGMRVRAILDGSSNNMKPKKGEDP